jgi:hypothetical protein
MEPFVGASADAFAPFIASIPDPVEAMRRAVAFKVGLAQKQAEIAQTVAQAQEINTQAYRAQLFQQDLKAVQADPSAKNVSALIMKYPEYGEQIKGGWDVKDKAAKDADLTQLSEVYSAAAAGNWDSPASRRRIASMPRRRRGPLTLAIRQCLTRSRPRQAATRSRRRTSSQHSERISPRLAERSISRASMAR